MKNILLVNYGGPEKKDQIRNYLFRLFSDRNVIKLPAGMLLQRPFASIISRVRYKKVQADYEAINYSPLVSITSFLADKLNGRGGDIYHPAMAYSQPFIDKVSKEIEDDLYIFPLFPHYSGTTTGACVAKVKGTNKQIHLMKEYWDDEKFNEIIIKSIKSKLTAGIKTAVIFSAHSIPLKYDRRGDPYLKQIHMHYALLKNKMKGTKTYLGFQSKLGPVEWAGPPLSEVFEQVKKDGFERVLIYPLSFTIDNFETLFELDIHYRNELENNIGLKYDRVSCMNDSDIFVDYIENKIKEDKWQG